MVGKKLWDSFKLVSGMIIPPPLPADSKISGLQDFTFPLLDGSILRLKDMAGQVVLVVNTASNCGFTPHYEKLEQLWQQYQRQGFFIIGIPSNNFAGQEPDSNQHIANFCQNQFSYNLPCYDQTRSDGPARASALSMVVSTIGEEGVARSGISINFYLTVMGMYGQAGLR
jgi:glutathione peroxidase